MSAVIKEAERLHKLGFAILWIKPKSKAPVKSKWTTGPREEWSSLRDSYRQGFNVGVRLGSPSKIAGKYLAVIDIDVKSTDVKHRAEAEAAVAELFPNLPKDVIQVMSGRGNGSSHIYVVTEKPASPIKKRVSNEKVKVYMPSADANASQREVLSEEDINEGIRLRPAWEIAVMGEGQQVLLPPSLHPDSGREYIWAKKLGGVQSLTTMDFGSKTKDLIRSATQDWKPRVVDLVGSTLPTDIVNLIMRGECEDRSAALFKVGIAMVREGFTDHDIMTVLTDTSLGLGTVAYEHTKNSSRERAANWVFNYTIKKCRKEVDSSYQFEEAVEVTELSEEAQAAQAEEILGGDWRLRLERNGPTGVNANKPRITVKNLVLILENDVGSGVFQRNLFWNRDTYGCDTPWGGLKGQSLNDDEILKIKHWLLNRHRIEPNLNALYEAVGMLALKNAFHPVRDYINSLEWDGIERLDTWLKDYLHATGPEPYVSEVSRKIVCAMVARVFEPGIKFDHMPILEGDQGMGKSSAVRIMASSKWFADNLPDLRTTDARLNLQGKWVVELGELANLKKSDVENVKNFITTQSDLVRAPYGRKHMDIPRQSVLFGSTNEKEYLKDKTGNRRFWPVRVGQCKFKELATVRDQLIAEAHFVWASLGEQLWLSKEAALQADIVQRSKVSEDLESIMLGEFVDFLEKGAKTINDDVFNLSSFRTKELFEDGPFNKYKADDYHVKHTTRILRNLGFESFGSRGFTKWRKPKSQKEGEIR